MLLLRISILNRCKYSPNSIGCAIVAGNLIFYDLMLLSQSQRIRDADLIPYSYILGGIVHQQTMDG